MKNIVIVGSGGFGREVAWLIEDINKVKPVWNIVGFVDDNNDLTDSTVNGYKVLGNIDWLIDKEVYVVIAIGDPVGKKNVFERIKNTNNSFPSLIHPSVIMSNSVNIGDGTIICAANILTVNIEIGNHVIINLDCTIGHDAVIHDYATILPSVNVSGYVDIGECVSVGTGSAIIQGLKIGDNAVIGAGSVVVKDIPANCTAVGVPAKPIKFHNQ